MVAHLKTGVMTGSFDRGRRRRWVILSICSLGVFMSYADTTILNVALPAIGDEFRSSVTSLQWIIDAYQLVLVSFLVLGGSIADRIGRRRVFCTGLVVFSLGSLLCSLAPSTGWLVSLRGLQALGGCMLSPVSLSIVRQVFTDPKERAKAMGLWSCIFGLAVASGPLLGGLLVTGVGWRSAFWINVPIGACAVLAARRVLPESRARNPRRFDPPGQVLVVVLLAALTYGIIEGPEQGWSSPRSVAAFIAAMLCTVALLLIEHRRIEPLLELRFFRSPAFSAAIIIAVASFLLLSGFLFVNTLYVQQVRGYSALLAGLAVLPSTALIALVAPLAGRLVATHGPRLPLSIAGICLAAGSAVLLAIAPDTPYPVLAGAYVLIGAGFGMINPPITNTAVSGMPPSQAGVASAIASSARQLGNVLGVAIMGSMVATTGQGAGRLSPAEGARFSAATHLPWAVGIALGILCLVLALVCTGPRGMRLSEAIYSDID